MADNPFGSENPFEQPSIAPTLPPGTVESEDNTGTSRYADRGMRNYDGIRGLHDAKGQLEVGAVKAFDVTSNVLESVTSIPEIVNDPGRLLDFAVPYVNFGITAAEYITQLGADLVTGSRSG